MIYHKDANGNFGDDLNEWIWDHLLPGWQTWDQSTALMGVGTLLNKKRLDPLRDRKLLIVGSGVGYGSVPALLWTSRSPLFPQLDAIGQSLRTRTLARTPHPETAAVSDQVITPPHYKKTVRRRVEGPIVAQRLRAISQQTPRLSDPSVLAGKKADYAKVLQGIRADYGGGSA